MIIKGDNTYKSIAAASVLAASAAGADAVDLAMDSLSGLTSQPNLGSVVGALRGRERDPGIDAGQIRAFSDYWEGVRAQYAAFESDLRFGASEVYLHEMPGGQFTNLKEQARSLGLEERWHDVARAYADVNDMLGDIVKVTPSSKMVGDMALMMVSADISRDEVQDPDKEIAFPDSVRSFFRGELGQPPGGFPSALQKKVLAGEAAMTDRPGANVPSADLNALRAEAEKKIARRVSDEEFNAYLMYPDVFTTYAAHRREYGPVDVLPSNTFFYGMQPDEEISVELEAGKILVIRYQAMGETDEDGFVKMFFELNGQPRTIRVPNREIAASVERHPQAEEGNPDQVAAPMPGVIGTIAVTQGQDVESGDLLMNIEAMKMETAIRAARPGRIHAIAVKAGMSVDAKDLLLEYAPST